MKTSTLLSLAVLLAGADATAAREPFVLQPDVAAPSRGPAFSGPAFNDPGIGRWDLSQPPPAPLPDRAGPEIEPAPSAIGELIELYPFVKYKDRDEMHPLAVKTVVSVPHPATGWKLCRCCPPPLVNVLICVPPNCGPPRVKYKRLFREYEYDFGKYAVDVRLRDGRIEVDYQD